LITARPHCAGAGSSNQPQPLKAGVPILADDDLVVHRNAERLRDYDDFFRHLNIRLRLFRARNGGAAHSIASSVHCYCVLRHQAPFDACPQGKAEAQELSRPWRGDRRRRNEHLELKRARRAVPNVTQLTALPSPPIS
jgi:hypothetical protein